MSHVAHPSGEPSASGLQFFGTDCPPSHPVRLPLLFLEIVWDTRPFNDLGMWPDDGSQPFVFSMGDPQAPSTFSTSRECELTTSIRNLHRTGFGQHADYVFGWEGDALQRAMDVCTLGDGIITNCPVLTVQTMDEMNTCRLPALVPEPVEEQYIPALPGCNPVQPGPLSATLSVPCDSAPSTTMPPPATSSTPPAIVTPPWTVCHEGPGSEPNVPGCDSIPTATTTATGPGVDI
ncbi:hypothetical protein FA13DRAFT_1507939 [Coprinellus micaceus]|uniref:DUF1996 domain-containing protein n=1 Tax=Coprinellus micaceus TaxID=71717 RepID=A0A4Y7SLP1_COPMI|nr:hypothetical protein FA13DRAFT_1507939 [Coprinellus micaceus]